MGKKEALVVGAGPSGLVAAINLQRDGFAVTVWEQEKEIGGNPHWHPSAHDTPVGKKLFEYIGIDLWECFHDYTENFQFIMNGNLIDYPASKKNPLYVCERGSRESSLDSTLYRIALKEGVKFEFGRAFTREDLKSKVLPEITILATTADVPYDSISFAEEMPEEMREQVIQSLLEISGTEEGRAALEVLYGVTGLQRADDAIYDGFRTELAQAGVDIEDLAK